MSADVGTVFYGSVVAVDPQARTITVHDPRWPRCNLPVPGDKTELAITYVSPYASLVEEEADHG